MTVTPAGTVGETLDATIAATWNEAANRRLRAMVWKGHPIGEIAFLLGRPVLAVQAQLGKLGLTG